MEITLILPYPPSVNNYKKVGRIVRTKSGKTYQQRVNTHQTSGYYYDVYMLSKSQMTTEWGKSAHSATISYDVRVTLHPPDKKRRDIDNVLKVLLDSLVHAKIIFDDSQITRLFVEKLYTLNQGKVFVTISEIENAHQ
jgi:crossover junction endodeoxyribonuclease RusA